MIRSKNKICIDCGRDDQPWFSKKRCKFCASKSYKSPSKKIKPKENKECLDKLFKDAIKKYTLKPYSEHDGTYISNISRINIAHLFYKRKYKSVACLMDNVMLLTWEQHTELDRLIDTNNIEEIEKRFPKIWLRIKKVLPLVHEQGKFKTAVNNYIDNDRNDNKN